MREWVLTRDNEVIFVSEYGFAWYMDGELMRTGCIENAEDGLGDLEDAGFKIAEV
jgi:hypothetical protein